MEVILPSISRSTLALAAWVSSYPARLSSLGQLWNSDKQAFFLTLAPALLLLLALVLIIVALSRRRKAAAAEQTLVNLDRYQPRPATTFVPVESSGADFDTVFLTLEDRIIDCKEHLDRVTAQRLVKNNPKSLSTIVSTYPRCAPGVQSDLARLVRDWRMMEGYSRNLAQEGYSQGVLVEAWSCFPDEKVLRGFVELLASRDEGVQMTAVRLLSALQETKVLPMLVLALVRPEVYLPARVAEVFISMPKASAELLAHMLPELDDKHKEAVLEIISQTGETFAPANVLTCLRHRNFRIRAAAALALGGGQVAEAVPYLLLAANDKRWQVRAAAAKALGLIGDSRAIPALEALLHDEEGWVAENARHSLAGFYNA